MVVNHDDHAQRQIDQELPNGAFTGVPFLLKDLGPRLAGTVTTSASKLDTQVAAADSPLTTLYKQAGLVIFGKTDTPELGLEPTTESVMFGPTRNPWNLERTAGGSSGGAAAAVAARIVPVAHASDGGGSIRIPASASGVFGLKPTRARNPVGPDRGEGWGGFSCGHVLSISVRDSAVMLDAVCGPEPSSPYQAPPPERPLPRKSNAIPGACASPLPTNRPMATPSIRRSPPRCGMSRALLAKLGHHVEERAPPLAADPAAVMATIVGSQHRD